MGIERQNIQLRLAFSEGDWGEAPGYSGEGTEVSVAVCTPGSPANDSRNRFWPSLQSRTKWSGYGNNGSKLERS
jgi:hypothetical protein